ncbi:MAG TPA: AAA family ATPase [Candidatus Hydrogenedentes bacterium]|nr:AAA family ATPase [Candidatus Hydrogenedentota bacterium]HPG66329.1 AAA family ATPase [Candidatus Hydrogenedentota bacterium]
MGQVIVVANQKGGVGKTTTAINLAACLAVAGHPCLLVDLDPQGNCTSGLGLVKNEVAPTTYDALVTQRPFSSVVRPTMVENLDIAPANKDLVGAEIELVGEERREYRLRHALDGAKDAYEYIFIDCPPSLGLLTVNGLVAADSVLIALQCEYYALEGLSELLHTVVLVRDRLNSSLRLQGVLLTMYQHTNLSRQVVADVRSHLGDKVYQTVIPRNVTISEAPSFGRPVILYDPACAGATAYAALAQEVASRG